MLRRIVQYELCDNAHQTFTLQQPADTRSGVVELCVPGVAERLQINQATAFVLVKLLEPFMRTGALPDDVRSYTARELAATVLVGGGSSGRPWDGREAPRQRDQDSNSRCRQRSGDVYEFQQLQAVRDASTLAQ